jgi:tetratricopeptide (TPR) repeat protein
MAEKNRNHMHLIAAVGLTLTISTLHRPAAVWAGRASSRHRRHVRRAEKAMRRKHYKKAVRELQKALVYKREVKRFYSLGYCFEKMGKVLQALFYYRLYVSEAPHGKLVRSARRRIAALEHRKAAARKKKPTPQAGGIVLRWVKRTGFASVRRVGRKKLIYAVDFRPAAAQKRKKRWRVFVQYLPKHKWILVFVTVLRGVGQMGRLPPKLLYRILHFNSVVPGAKLSVDKSTGNVDVQYELPEAHATVSLLDFAVREVVNTADQLHDQLQKMARSQTPRQTAR